MAISGIGVLWYIQVLWIFSMLLLLVRKLEKDRIWILWKKHRCGFSFFTGYFIFSHDEVVERLSKWWGILLIIAGGTGIFYTVYYFGENYAAEPVINNLAVCVYCWFAILAILAFMKKYGDRENMFSELLK